MVNRGGKENQTVRVLLIAEAANPEWVSVPLIGWSLSRAISAHVSSHLVTQSRNRQPLLRAGLIEGKDFTAIDSEKIAAPVYRLGDFLRGGKGIGWTTLAATASLSYYYFEWLVWKQFGDAIRLGQYDIVHRITPLSPTMPSILAKRCLRASTPFILGPLNGGVPWPKDFKSARHKEREWLSYVRSAYKLLPGHGSTLNDSAVIIVGSRSTYSEIPERLKHKCVYLPENGIDPLRFSAPAPIKPSAVIRACFIGRLVPYKAPDLLLEAIAPLVRGGRIILDVFGDGPLLPELKRFVQENSLESGVTLHGFIENSVLQSAMRKSQLLLFPSIREFGGAVVLEAMALGIVPIVIDYAGPGELVTEAVGFKIPIGTRESIVRHLRETVSAICDAPDQLIPKSIAGLARVQKLFTWDVKARQIVQIYRWAQDQTVGKPEFFPEFLNSTAS